MTIWTALVGLVVVAGVITMVGCAVLWLMPSSEDKDPGWFAKSMTAVTFGAGGVVGAFLGLAIVVGAGFLLFAFGVTILGLGDDSQQNTPTQDAPDNYYEDAPYHYGP